MFLDSVQDRIPMVVLQAWSLELIKAVMARYSVLFLDLLTVNILNYILMKNDALPGTRSFFQKH